MKSKNQSSHDFVETVAMFSAVVGMVVFIGSLWTGSDVAAGLAATAIGGGSFCLAILTFLDPFSVNRRY